MKTSLQILLLLLFTLGSCTEEIIKIEKEIVRDTVTVDRFIDRYFSGTDTVTITQIVEVQTPVRSESDTVVVYQTKYDTIYSHRIDTIWITKTVHQTDTIMIRETIYGDTLIHWYARDQFSIPEEVIPMYSEFFAECSKRGFTPTGGKVLVLIEKTDAVVQSYSFDYSAQHVIVLSDRLTEDERMLPFWRELSRWQLHREYSADPEHPMHFYYPSHLVRWSNRSQHKAIIDKIYQ